MACKTDNFKFDPDKTALENLFALIYRTNRVKLNPNMVEVELPRALQPGEDEHDAEDNTVILVKAKPNTPFKGEHDLFYARADINTHYPTFSIDLEDVKDIHDKSALIAYLDGRFNLVDGEFDIDIEDPFKSLFYFLDVDIFAKEKSLIYIGDKKIHLFWSGGIRRITDEGRLRITDEGQIRVIPLGSLD
jgi:hypothetical protein